MNAQTSTSKLIKGATGDWEIVIGMEVHAQVNAKAKLFSAAATAFGGEPNSHVSLVDAAMPGMLPVINEECVAQAVRTGLGLNAKINLRSVFDRKNYFYPDLPQGYQISQYKSPVVGEGEIAVDMPYGTVRVGIERLHLEQDAGKSLHDQHPAMSLVDLNRSGVALMEIVSKPDLRSSEEAKAFLAKLRAILRYLGTCDGDMEKGNLRADVNVSVRRPGDPLGTRCEIKNVNSIRFIGQAIDYEARRQIEILEDGGAIEQETRLYDAPRNQTRSMRNKEEAHDYRYFPDPDLLPLELSEAYVAELSRQLPELPDARKARFMSSFGLNDEQASRLTSQRDLAEVVELEFFMYVALARGNQAEELCRAAYGEAGSKLETEDFNAFSSRRAAAEPYVRTLLEGAQNIANLVLGPVLAKSNEDDSDPVDIIKRIQLPMLVRLILQKDISPSSAKRVMDLMWTQGGDPASIIEIYGLKQVTDTAAIEKLVDEVIANNPGKVSQAKTKPAMIGWFVGQVMKASGGKANPQTVNELIKAKLDL
jgi:aspartyl-tRNA(Asn)/glutamyl-tRNA(Gln) amidotransferase subunit B